MLRLENGETIALTQDHRASEGAELKRIINNGGVVKVSFFFFFLNS